MVILLPLLMAYSLIGETFHELAGVAMLLLFIAHHVQHRAWLRTLRKGRYTPYRVFITVLHALLFVLMLAQPITGILVSRHLFTFLHVSGTAHTARSLHMALAYWCFALMSLHLGLHLDAMLHGLKPNVRKLILGAALLISCYGVYAFIKRGFPGYMFMTTRFAFFDFREPRLYFFADYLAVLILFAFLGIAADRLLRRNETK